MIKISDNKKREIYGMIPMDLDGSSGGKLIKERIEAELKKVAESDTKEICKHFIISFKKFRKILEHFEEEKSDLDTGCKEFIDTIIKQLYDLDKKKSINPRLWNHVPEIMHVNVVIDEYVSKGIFDMMKEETFIHNILSLYSDIYELTIKLLSEYAYTIALHMNDDKKYISSFIDTYEKYEEKNRSVPTGILLTFYKNTNFLKECIVLKTDLRNAIAHASKYQNDEKLIINKNKEIGKEELKSIILQLRNFYFYFICSAMRETGLIKTIIKTEKNYRKIYRSL